jgi:hypothetical protein
MPAGGEPLGERVPGRGAAGVDRLAVLAVLRRFKEQVPGDFDDLAVDDDDAGVLGCGDSVGILKIAACACVIFASSLPAFPQAGRLTLAIRGSAPTATRTRDLPLRRRSLYPLSYRGLPKPYVTWDGARSLPSA